MFRKLSGLHPVAFEVLLADGLPEFAAAEERRLQMIDIMEPENRVSYNLDIIH